MRAVEVARVQGARSLELRAAMSLGRLWRAKGLDDAARRTLAEVYGRSQEGFARPTCARRAPCSAASLERMMRMKLLRRTLCASALLACLLLSPASAWACACCSDAGAYHVGSARPSQHELGLLREMRFGGTAHLHLTAADDSAKALGLPAENYKLSGSLVGNAWRLTFREGSHAGTLNLPLPARMTSYAVDIHDGQTSAGGGPLLYKEWRFEGTATGTGIFKAGTAAPARYLLVLQGRGNSCANAEDFTHWLLKINGRRAAYTFFGELGRPRAGG